MHCTKGYVVASPHPPTPARAVSSAPPAPAPAAAAPAAARGAASGAAGGAAVYAYTGLRPRARSQSHQSHLYLKHARLFLRLSKKGRLITPSRECDVQYLVWLWLF